MQFQFSVGPGSTAIFGHKSVMQPFSILKTLNKNLKPSQKMTFLHKKVGFLLQIVLAYISREIQFTLLNASEMNRLGATVS